jgi:hypothetical protein
VENTDDFLHILGDKLVDDSSEDTGTEVGKEVCKADIKMERFRILILSACKRRCGNISNKLRIVGSLF